MQLKGKKVAVLGMGASGIAAAQLCLHEGAIVVGFDERAVSKLSAEARGLHIRIVASLQDEPITEAEIVVLSPGIPVRPEIDELANNGAIVIGELELAASFLSCPICAIGGTNGKSTTTGLVGAMASSAGQRVFCGGNLGTPLSCAVGEPLDLAVVEVSSFQLEKAPHFRPRVSVLLNISEDHLDRHGTLESYASCKGNAFANQGPQDAAVGCAGDPLVLLQMKRGSGETVLFGASGDYTIEEPLSGETGAGGGWIVEQATGEQFSLSDSQLAGQHNLLNAAAAIAAARKLGISLTDIRQGLKDYCPLPHRRERVAVLEGVTYYDDSKATNVGAAAAAVRGLAERHVVLIAGGKDKGGSYSALREALAARARAVVLIGEAADLMEAQLLGQWPIVRAGDMFEAVRTAGQLAQPGDAVLLSPACSSFDMFSSYADRGRKFSEAVHLLKTNKAESHGA